MTAQGVRYVVEVEGARHEVVIGADGSLWAGGRQRAASLAEAGGVRSLLLDGVSVPLLARYGGLGRWEIGLDGRTVDVQVFEAREAEIRERSASVAGSAGIAPLKAPMPGLVVRVAVCEGEVVQAGAPILIVEAMKMENELRAPAAARVVRIPVSPGDAVEKAQVVAEFEEVESP